MAEHRLHTAKIGAAFKECSRKAVPDNVRRQVPKDAGCASVTRQKFPERLSSERAAACRDEQIRAGAPTQQAEAPVANVGFDSFECRSPGGYDALLVALTRCPQVSKRGFQFAGAQP